MKARLIAAVTILFLLATACKAPEGKKRSENSYTPLNEREVKTTSDGTKYVVHPSNLEDGGPPKDGIPSIDNPEFVSVQEADQWIQDNELIISLQFNNATRAYPLQIMVWHEIVNDEINGVPVAITYCPLCKYSVAYKRTIKGTPVEFGTSGKLYNSNLVMYDRKTNSYWSQIDGVAIKGELAGKELKQTPADVVSWGGWKKNNQGAKVLSKDTGYDRNYGEDPYGGYYNDSFLMFKVENKDNRIHAKEEVIGIEVDGTYKAYRVSDIKEKGKIEDTVKGVRIKLERKASGEIDVINTESGEKITKERGFWFAWYAFHPNTELYGFSGEN